MITKTRRSRRKKAAFRSSIKKSEKFWWTKKTLISTSWCLKPSSKGKKRNEMRNLRKVHWNSNGDDFEPVIGSEIWVSCCLLIKFREIWIAGFFISLFLRNNTFSKVSLFLIEKPKNGVELPLKNPISPARKRVPAEHIGGCWRMSRCDVVKWLLEVKTVLSNCFEHFCSKLKRQRENQFFWFFRFLQFPTSFWSFGKLWSSKLVQIVFGLRCSAYFFLFDFADWFR